MCRLLGVVSSEATDFRFSLHTAPRSLASLSHQHPDGWGLAVHDEGPGWTVAKHPMCAGVDERFDEAATTSRGKMLVAHVRKRTVGSIGVENTHPFLRGHWVFAHNGTITATGWLEERTSPARRAEVEGTTDSERFFAYLLTRIDACTNPAGVPEALVVAMREAIAVPGFGSANFLLADGQTLYAHRAGRTLFVLERGQADSVRVSRKSLETGAVVETPWSARRWALMIASEHMTDEPWEEIGEGVLLRIDGGAQPSWRPIGRTA